MPYLYVIFNTKGEKLMEVFAGLSSPIDHDILSTYSDDLDSVKIGTRVFSKIADELEKFLLSISHWNSGYHSLKIGRRSITHIKGIQVKHLLNLSFLLILITLSRVSNTETYSIQLLIKKLKTITLPIVFINTRNFSIQKNLSISA